MYDDLVSIEVDELKESSGELTVSYEDDECSLNFAIRYAMNEDDCNAAYDEFKADKDAEKFNFADYNMKVEYDEYCVAQLVLNLKKDQGVSLKKAASLKSLHYNRSYNTYRCGVHHSPKSVCCYPSA